MANNIYENINCKGNIFILKPPKCIAWSLFGNILIVASETQKVIGFCSHPCSLKMLVKEPQS